MSKYYTIKITGGTSDGPYTIYNCGYQTSNIALRYPSLTPASGLTKTVLTGDTVIIIVPDECNTVYLSNTLCGIKQSFDVTSPIVYKDFCLKIPYGKNSYSYDHFIFGGVDINGNPFWNSDNMVSTINWVVNKWVLDEDTYSSTPLNSNPPYTGWFKSGYGLFDGNIGSCHNQGETSRISINQPTCSCDGVIIFDTTLENPPFTYSIDNGVTFSDLPVFTNLCSGIYSLVTIDSLLNEYYQTVEILSPTMETTYSLSLVTTSTITVNTTTALSKSYQTNVVVTPPLPDGATITFDLIHNNSFYSSPLSGTSILTTGTILSKDSITVPISTSTTGSSQSINTNPGCQTLSVYQTDLTEVWDSITITNTNDVMVSTTTRVDKTITGSCVVGYSNDSYSIGNAKLTGCDCCTLIINT